MIKYLVGLSLLAVLGACNTPSTSEIGELREEVAALKTALKEAQEEAYHPELSAHMLGIQAHHEKLYYAGEARNWELAHYNIHEIEEWVEEIGELFPMHNEVDIKSLSETMLDSGIEAVETSIAKKDLEAFKTGFKLLSSNCNACHIAAGYPEIRVLTPSGPGYTNQDFSAAE